MGMLRAGAAVIVRGHFPFVGFSGFRRQPGGAVSRRVSRPDGGAVVVQGQDHLFRYDLFPHQVQHQRFRHLPDDQLRLVRGIGLHEHLSGADAVRFRFVGLDVRHSCRFPAPGVIDEKLRVDAQGVVQRVLVGGAQPGHVPHGEAAQVFQPLRDAPAHAPEVRQRPVAPEGFPVGLFVQLRDAHAVFIRLHVLGHDVHGHLGQVQVRPNAGGGSDAGFFIHLMDQPGGQFPAGAFVGLQVACGINEAFVNGIDMDVFRGNIPEIYGIDLRADLLIQQHPGRGGDVRRLQGRVGLQFFCVFGFSCWLQAHSPGFPCALQVHFPHPGNHLEQAGAAGDAVDLQGR